MSTMGKVFIVLGLVCFVFGLGASITISLFARPYEMLVVLGSMLLCGFFIVLGFRSRKRKEKAL